MRPEWERRLRPALGAIVTQGWLIGAIGGTAADMSLLRLLDALPAEVKSVSVGVAIIAALGLSCVPCVLGIVAVMIAPHAVLHHRRLLCLAMPVAATGLWAGLVGFAVPDALALTALVFLDAALAALWCWHRTKGLHPDRAAQLAKVFE